jgi:hypothetical protein
MSVLPARVDGLSWDVIGRALDADGFAMTDAPLLTRDECASVRAMFDEPEHFRATIDMARHRFGEGMYRYFTSPLPPIVASLREHAYPHLATIVNRWDKSRAFPATHAELLAECNRAGQTRPTPLLLRYEVGGWNALHQDLYGDVYFPLQMAIALSRPGADYDGGEMLFVEQRPRSQSRGSALVPPLGHAVVFATNRRPVAGARGTYQTTMRHGVSVVRRGTRLTLGVIFHDAT